LENIWICNKCSNTFCTECVDELTRGRELERIEDLFEPADVRLCPDCCVILQEADKYTCSECGGNNTYLIEDGKMYCTGNACSDCSPVLQRKSDVRDS
jgi:hypothetical protein